jgi:hypothetical protein
MGRGAAGRGRAVARSAPARAAVPVSRRRRYPDFGRPLATEQRLVTHEARRLRSQTGIPIRSDQILEAPWIGRGTPRSTSEGWLRDSRSFWRAYARHAPREHALLRGRHVVTPAYARAMSWPDSTVGQRLEHHHINNSRYVIPLPAGVHTPAVHRTATVVM